MESPLSRELQGILRKLPPGVNPALLLTRYLFRDGIPKDLGKMKKKELETIRGAIASFEKNPLFRAFRDRWEEMLKQFAARNSKGLHRGKAAPWWRVIVGLGGECTLETNITVHPLYGFPVIPGSALKGMTRHYVRQEYGESCPGEREVFGTSNEKDGSGNAGKVVFFDAIPQSLSQVEIDIMTPHYQPYYTNPEKDKPADWHSPNPISFLVCGKMEFRFAVWSEDGAVAKQAWQWLTEALQNQGAGAKTAVGYGYFGEMK